LDLASLRLLENPGKIAGYSSSIETDPGKWYIDPGRYSYAQIQAPMSFNYSAGMDTTTDIPLNRFYGCHGS
jgi:hypothetical protein